MAGTLSRRGTADVLTTALASPMRDEAEFIPPSTRIADTLKDAWEAQCTSITDVEKEKLASYACSDLADYLEKLEAACDKQKETSHSQKIVEWFEPLFKAVELLTPAAAVAIQAYPNPGSLVLGGVVGVLQTTERLIRYQKLAVQHLRQMGAKASVLLAYERDVYKDDRIVMEALFKVYGDIIKYCTQAFRFLTKDGHLRAKVRGLKLILISDFESQLGEIVQKFKVDMDDLKAQALLCDKRRLNKLRKNHEEHHKDFEQMSTESRQFFQRGNDFFDSYFRRKEERLQGLYMVLPTKLKVLISVIEEALQKKEQDKARALQWLSPLTFREIYEDRCKEHLEGTGIWLLESSEFTNLKSGLGPDLLWVRGKPGCGKSYLAAVTVTELKTEVWPGSDTALAYAFCRKGDESSRNTSAIFASLAMQICQHQSDINSRLNTEYLQSHPGETLSRATMHAILKLAFSQFKQTFIVVDGLDECEDEGRLAQDLRDLVQENPHSPVKVIVFSRSPYILEKCFGQYTQVAPDQGANEKDLERYIESRFRDDNENDPSAVNQQIRHLCLTKAEGMFQWVKLLAESFEQEPLPDDLKVQKILELPPGLDGMYKDMLSDIWSQKEPLRSKAFLVLTWVQHARRALSQLEMLEAINDYSKVSSLEKSQTGRFKSAEHLVAICKNLVFIDKDGCFRMCHESVNDHLNKEPEDDNEPLKQYQARQKDSHRHLAEICLLYLLLEDFETGPTRSVGALKTLKRRAPFIAYAAAYWGQHASEASAPALQNLVVRFIRRTATRDLAMQVLLHERTDYGVFTREPRTNPLHMLSIFGLKSVSEAWPEAKRLTQTVDSSGHTPLMYAILEGHYEMSLWLIEQLGDIPQLSLQAWSTVRTIHIAAGLGWNDVLDKLIPNDTDFVNSRMQTSGQTLLVTACKFGKRETVEKLIAKKADVNLSDGNGDTPLIIAALSGDKDTAKLLLVHGADPDGRDGDHATPLHYAASNNHSGVVDVLLEHGADATAPVSTAAGQTAMHFAAESQALDVIESLHKKTAMLDILADDDNTPLHIAAWHNSSKAAKLLLEMGASKDAVQKDKETALFVAARCAARETIKVLVDGGCNITVPSSVSRTAMHEAALSGVRSSVYTILNSQPQSKWKTIIDQPSQSGETCLHDAVEGGNPEIVKLLLKRGADVTVKGRLDSSPLHYAAHYGYVAMLRPIIRRSKDPNVQNESGDTPLHFAARSGRLQFILKFFDVCNEHGLTVDIDVANRSGSTPLHAALSTDGFAEIARLLIDKGASSKPNDDKNYPIHYAAWRGFHSIVDLLRTLPGANQKGYFGRTPLHITSIIGDQHSARLLAETAPENLNEPDDNQITPVMMAIARRHLEVANYLLDIGCDHECKDDSGTGLLHFAAGIGDSTMVQRLLDLGCKPSSTNRWRETALFNAVNANSVKVVDMLIDAGISATDAIDSYGSTCLLTATQTGNLEMVKKLEAAGARYGGSNDVHITMAHVAAGEGHLEVLEHMCERGEPLGSLDWSGQTPLMIAAASGYPNTVQYLLRTQSPTINESHGWRRVTPLTEAARAFYPRTIRCLLAAGADPYQRDFRGCNAFDYATHHPASMRELEAAGFARPASADETQQQILRNTIQHCCKTILNIPPDPSIEHTFDQCDQLNQLAYALLRIRDLEAAKTCFFETFHPEKLAVVRANWRCRICDSRNFEGDKHVCMTCGETCEICDSCWKAYKSEGNASPEALNELMGLEEVVSRVRLALPMDSSLLKVYDAMTYFVPGSDWLSDVLDIYDAWEQKYNPTGTYSESKRPGYTFLKMIKDANGLLSKIFSPLRTEEDVVQLEQLYDDFEIHQRKYRADKEASEFICHDHEYFVVSEKEYESAKTAGIDLDSTTGKTTSSFIRRILEKYSDELKDAPLSQNMYPSHGSMPHANQVDTDMKGTNKRNPRPRELMRAYSTHWKSTKSPSILVPQQVPANLSSRRSTLPVDTSSRAPRRARTLPTSFERFSEARRQSVLVELKDNIIPFEVQALITKVGGTAAEELANMNPGHITVMRPLTVALVTASGNPQDASMDTLSQSNETDLAASEELMLALTLSSEPESLQELGLQPSTDTGVDSNAEAEEQLLDRDEMTAYIIQHDDDSDSDQGVARLIAALTITEAMLPGFIARYWKQRKDEQDELEAQLEEQERAKGASPVVNGSDGGSEDDITDDSD